jgi:UDP-N-acetylglucosamine--N-acetylmuramyl-(pentapeptide) pyrophosphoryl-undecaprenol N-acetylglucosamine transferase
LTIVLTGGGSGGHVTPIIAIAAELKKLSPESKIIYIGQKGDKMADVPTQDPNVDQTYLIYAGKFRRFHGEGFKQIFDLKTLYLNTRDFFFVLIGIIQSWRLTKEIQPDIIFSRGGYVSVPVCLGGHLNQIPYITHDSDPIPSLANRIIARWAELHAVALPKDIYPYSQSKTVTTGIPVNSKFVNVTAELKNEYRDEIGIPPKSKMLFVIGGGLGSQNVNKAVCEIVPHLLKQHPHLQVVHIAGANNENYVHADYQQNLSAEEQGRVKVFGYISDVYRYSGAADIVITRAGATNLAEFALQGKACIVIPSPFLTGGHQMKNAEYLQDQDAIIVSHEADLVDNANRLAKQINGLLDDEKKQAELSLNLSQFAKPDATRQIADLILELGGDETKEI